MMAAVKTQKIPLKMVGSTDFGRYDKISVEQTFNMIESDGWMVPYPGYKKVMSIETQGEGRGIYASEKLNKLVVAIDEKIFTVDRNIQVKEQIGDINSSTGDVFITENNAKQIAICDKKDMWIYDYENDEFERSETDGQPLDFRPGYVEFQGTYFIAPDLNAAEWHLSENNNGFNFPALSKGEFQTKSDFPTAILAVPSKGNLLLVQGKKVGEYWQNTGAQLFPYQKNTTANIDFGLVNAATIDKMDNIMIWVGGNEKAGISIMIYLDGQILRLSNDGIDARLSRLINPSNCYGFLIRQEGHLLYQVTWPDPRDNLSFVYDFTTKKFYSLSDPNMNFHIAKRVVQFNETYYFVSLVDGDLYEMNPRYTNYDGKEIPRVRVLPTFRLPTNEGFITSYADFVLEQGASSTLQSVDLTISYDGGKRWTSSYRQELNALGHYRNNLNYTDLGWGSEITLQFRFWGQGRFLMTDGVMEIY